MTSLAINDPSDNQKKHILDPVCIFNFFFPFSLLPVDGNAFERTDCFKKSSGADQKVQHTTCAIMVGR